MRSLFLLVAFIPLQFAVRSSAQAPATDANGDALPEGAVVRLGTLRFQLPTRDALVALSPDGSSVAVATRSGDKLHIDFMDTATGKITRELDLKEVWGERMQFSPDGNLVFVHWTGITIVDRAGKVAATFEVKTSGSHGFSRSSESSTVAFTGDGKWVAAQLEKYAYDAPVRIWDTTTREAVDTLPGRGAACQGLVIGPEGKRLLLWSVIPAHADGKSIGFDSNSKSALTCIDSGARKIVGKAMVTIEQQVALAPDGETVAIESDDHTNVSILHLPTGVERCVVKAKKPKLAFMPDGKALLTIDEQGQAALWEAAKGTKIRDLAGALSSKDFRVFGISSNSKTIAVIEGGWPSAKTVVVWNADTGKRVGRPAGHEGAVRCVAYAPDGKLLASGSADKTVRLWNPATGEHVRILSVHKDSVMAIAFSSDGKTLASSSQDGVTHVCNVADGKAVAEFAGPKFGATALAFAPKGDVLYAGGSSPELLAWEIVGGKQVIKLATGASGSVLAFAGGGALALAENRGRLGRDTSERMSEQLDVWNPATQRTLATIPIRPTLQNHYGSVYCQRAVFSPDGRIIATSQITEMEGIRPSYGFAGLRLWERATGQEIGTLGATITKALAFSPDGRLLASGGPGKSGHLRVGYGAGVDIWDVFAGKKIRTLNVSPQCVAFSPDGSHIATGSADNEVLIWKAPRLKRPKDLDPPTKAQRDAWWPAFSGAAKTAYAAMGEMIDYPEEALATLKEHVKPAKAGDEGVVAKLIARLNSPTYAERAKAEAELEKMGEGAAHLLKKQLQAADNSLDMQRRLEKLLQKSDASNATSVLGMQHHRAVELLEWINTPEARSHLRELAQGAPAARLTLESKAALGRLEN